MTTVNFINWLTTSRSPMGSLVGSPESFLCEPRHCTDADRPPALSECLIRIATRPRPGVAGTWGSGMSDHRTRDPYRCPPPRRSCQRQLGIDHQAALNPQCRYGVGQIPPRTAIRGRRRHPCAEVGGLCAWATSRQPAAGSTSGRSTLWKRKPSAPSCTPPRRWGLRSVRPKPAG